MTNVRVDFTKTVGKIKPMHAVGQPPFAGGFLSFDFSYIDYLKKAHIPYSRLHDVGGVFGGNRFVDIPNLFRDFDADENDPASYDFGFTDALIAGMYEYDVKPVFRLGVTIENQAHIKAYRIHPPKDPAKWARICEHVIRHYNEGWADGYTYGIEYWEIWNEPENGPQGQNQMWTGTAAQFYELYDVTAKHLKACFGDTIKVGGYGASGLYGLYYHPEKYGLDLPPREPDDRYEKDTYRVKFFLDFLDYIKEHGSPLDFFTWHSYAKIEKTLVMDEFIDRKLTEYGFEGLERHLNEWNNVRDARKHGSSYSSAASTAMLCAMHPSHTDMLMFYDSRLQASTYGNFFAPLTYEPVSTYYAFAAFGELYTLGTEAACTIDEPRNGLYALAATDGENKAVLIVNFSEERREIALDAAGTQSVYLVDHDHMLTKTDYAPNTFALEPNQVVLVKSEPTKDVSDNADTNKNVNFAFIW